MFTLQIIVEDDGGGDGVNASLITPVAFLHAAVYHRLVGDCTRESLVIHDDGHIGHFLAQPVDERRDILHALARLAIELRGLSYDNELHLLAAHVVLDELHEGVGRNCRQISRNDLQRVGNSNTSALAPIVDAQNASHQPQQSIK